MSQANLPGVNERSACVPHVVTCPKASASRRQNEQDLGYLDKLIDRQPRAVTFGSGDGLPTTLLLIAGTGSGKTPTLAHRVAHLLLNGADLQRILSTTF